ncbi:MAG: tetratricopeptide repeat protein [Acidobacteria bacterium]|nr:tetratricopeptide repeat protein [Acidobacteriota bacterium]
MDQPESIRFRVPAFPARKTGLALFLSSLLLALMLAPAAAQEKAVTPADLNKADQLFKSGCREAEKKNYTQAEDLFRQALAVYPLMPGAYVELGKIQMAQNNPAKALEFYLKAKDAYVALHDEKQKKEMSQQHADRDFALKGQDAQASGYKDSGGFAKQYAKQSKDQRREDDREVVATQGEADIPALFYLYLGGAYLRLSRAPEAEKELLAGLAKDPKLAPLHFNLSLAFFLQGKYPEAAAEARQAKQLKFQLPPAYVKDLETKGNVKVE